MTLDHFSHHHPLMLINELPTEPYSRWCDGCSRQMSSKCVAYSCSKCKYFLHEECAKLPMEIKHPKHEQHPLKLYPYIAYGKWKGCRCDVCGIQEWWRFTYSCKICEFDVHLGCALGKSVIKHESHPHALTVVHKRSLFECDACGEEAKDYSLFCGTCEFWIHDKCASLPSTIEHRDHDHPLVLNYFLPYENRSFRYDCDICKKKVHPNKWVYSCDICRYFAHLKCVTSDQFSRGDVIADDPETVRRFPLLLNEVSLAGTKMAPKIDHVSHGHPLVLFGDQTSNIVMEDKEVIICDSCILPIITSATTFYGCRQCSYFLHKSCTKLPSKLQEHPCHPDHLFKLFAPKSIAHNKRCKSCETYTNGFYYDCKTCFYNLDISCSNFTRIIKHEGHKHPLHINYFKDNNSFKCGSCGDDNRGLTFSCDPCDFHLEAYCAGLPGTFKHDWDDHPFILSYPPYSDHPSRFYCEICEEEMYPKNWAYRSSSGINFYHVKCVIPHDEYSKTKFNGTLTLIKHHPHPLTFVRMSKNKSPSVCDCCYKDSKGIPIMECAPCNFVICRNCCTFIIRRGQF